MATSVLINFINVDNIFFMISFFIAFYYPVNIISMTWYETEYTCHNTTYKTKRSHFVKQVHNINPQTTSKTTHIPVGVGCWKLDVLKLSNANIFFL